MNYLKLLDPKNDLVFKRIFGTDKNKDILIHFLNDMLRANTTSKITNVNLMNTNQSSLSTLGKQSIIDVLCTDDTGTMFIVEMQVAKVRGFEKRALYYASRAYANQLKSGENYSQLKEIIFLAIVNFVMFPQKPGYKSDHVILDKISFEHDLKDFSFTFIELPKFNIENVEDLKTFEEKWCYFFKHSDDTESMETLIHEDDQIIGKAYQELMLTKYNEEEMRIYEANAKIELDALARESQVRFEGFTEGEAKGKADGKAEGKAEGEAKGKAETQIKIAKAMLNEKIDLDTIVKVSGLTKKELAKLQNPTK